MLPSKQVQFPRRHRHQGPPPQKCKLILINCNYVFQHVFIYLSLHTWLSHAFDFYIRFCSVKVKLLVAFMIIYKVKNWGFSQTYFLKFEAYTRKVCLRSMWARNKKQVMCTKTSFCFIIIIITSFSSRAPPITSSADPSSWRVSGFQPTPRTSSSFLIEGFPLMKKQWVLHVPRCSWSLL